MVTCFGCGGRFPDVEGPTHRYMKSTPGCWACYGEVLSLEYGDLEYQAVHRLTVDTYAVQHPGRPSQQSIRSVALHLIGLCAVLEDGIELDGAIGVLQQAAKRKDRFVWLEPPTSMGSLTVADVRKAANPKEHAEAVRAWSHAAWDAWSAHHPTIRTWLSECWTV